MEIRCKCSVFMLKAAEGDCFFLSFMFGDNTFNLLVDAGPTSCWSNGLKDLLDRLASEEERIDVVLLTHIDDDHICGAIKLFECEQYSSLVDHVWFNGLKQITIKDEAEATENEKVAFLKLKSMHWHDYSEPNEPISAKRAESLSTLLSNRNITVNEFAGEGPITATTKSLQLSPEFSIDFLLPTEKRLSKLKSRFHVAMNQVVFGTSIVASPDGESAFEYVMLDEKNGDFRSEKISSSRLNSSNIEKWAKMNIDGDTSITNASSIAICIRFYGRKFLFPGDAIADDLINALRDWSRDYNEDLFFDIIKLPHHGSERNCMKLLDAIEGKYYLISTDGKKFSHPGKETIAKIVTRPTDSKRYLIFNYKNEMYQLFDNKEMAERYNYCVVLNSAPLEMECGSK